VHGEGELKVHGLFGPQGPVIVERRDAVRRLDEAWPIASNGTLHEGQQRRLCGSFIPGAQRVRGLCSCRRHREQRSKPDEQNAQAPRAMRQEA
jgi:hypothetical protein